MVNEFETPQGAVFSKTLSTIVSAREFHVRYLILLIWPTNEIILFLEKRAKRKNKRVIDIAYKLRQIPVCSAHHKLITHGKYSSPSLRKLLAYDAGDVPRNKGVKF